MRQRIELHVGVVSLRVAAAVCGLEQQQQQQQENVYIIVISIITVWSLQNVYNSGLFTRRQLIPRAPSLTAAGHSYDALT